MSVVSSPERMLFDRRARSKDLCASADTAIEKGDFGLAKRLLFQADIDDPRNRYAQERITWLEHHIEHFEKLKFDAKPEGRKFDFIYTPTLRGLSTELSSLLPLHPGVISVPKHELDEAIQGQNERGLLAKYQQQVLNGREHLRAGLIQHAFIANQLAGPEVAERLASVTTRKLFVHGVRDPVQLAISDFNHELIARYCGSYFFRPVYPKSPFGRKVYTLSEGPKDKRFRTLRRLATRIVAECLSTRPVYGFSVNSTVIQERLNEAISRPRHFTVGQTYAQHFDAWVPVDLERGSLKQMPVVSRVFEAVGVDARFNHPALRVSEGTRVHRLMVRNSIEIYAFGHRLLLGLGFADRMMFSNTFPLYEMLPFDPDDRFSVLGLGVHPLCVTVNWDYWAMLPRDIRIRVVESDELLRFRDLILIPAWLDSYANWESIMAEYLVQELAPTVLSRLRARIGDDFEQFLKRHSNFEHRWPLAEAVLGQSVVGSVATRYRISRKDEAM
jgi:hypothetical protein